MLTSAFVDFYSTDAIIEAKQRLVDDVGLLSVSDKLSDAEYIPSSKENLANIGPVLDQDKNIDPILGQY
jgi:hypothetical protein